MEKLKKKNEILLLIIVVVSILLVVLFVALIASLLLFVKQQGEDSLADDSVIVVTEVEKADESEFDWGDEEEDFGDMEEQEETEDASSITNDPYGIYVTDESWLKEYNGFAVERNGRLYSLAYTMPYRVISEYNSGYQGGASCEDLPAMLYAVEQRKITDVPTEATDAITLIGDFPTYYVDMGEELRVYNSNPIEEIDIEKLEFYGYTIPAIGRQSTYFPLRDRVLCGLSGIQNVALLTSDGDPVNDVRKLEYGKDYVFEWYEGTEYHSEIYSANCRCYIKDGSSLKVPVKMTKNGYGVVDLTGLEPGSYLIYGHLPFDYVE